MPTADTHNHANDIPCPDPSVHEKNDRLSAQASTAALYVTQPHKGTDPREPKEDVLGKDGKLSSKSAATSLKYAKATDLPSFPSHGGESNAAGSAAMLAKDYKMKDLWQPEPSMAGAKAASKAQKDGGKLDLWQYEQSKNGLSAAALAMRKNTQTPLSPNIDRGYTDAGKSNSLLAATKSAKSSRQRSDSTPVRPPPLYPDQTNSARNALSAATVSHRKSVRAQPAQKEEGWASEANQAARIQNSNMERDMFGSNPQVEPEVEEKKHQAALRASAVSMAKNMYDVQNRAMLASAEDNSNIGSAGAETAHKRNASAVSQPDLKQQAMQYITLQDQAQKLAQERLAKVDKDMENSKYREYYGYSDKSPRKSRLSMRGRRNRASSEGAEKGDSDDEEQARKIRTQMSQLNTASSNVSDKQRDDDRARLLKAAEKRVHDRMSAMDEKVFTETGKPSQAMMDDWESKAREKAESDRAERQKHPGKTHIGGGKYMDQSEIEAIAAARLKPTLDKLDENATKRRERDAEIAKNRDLAETERMEEKIRNDQQKTEFKRIKEQDKAAARKEKDERKAAQREEKMRKSEDQRKSRDMKRNDATTAAGGAALGESVNKARDDDEPLEEPQQDAKDKRKSRGVFGRFTDKFRNDKPATQPEKADDKTIDRSNKDDEPETGGPVAAVASGSGATESTGADKAAADNDSMYDVSSRDADGARQVESRSDFESTRDNRSSTADQKGAEDEPHSQDISYGGAAAAVAAGTAGVGGLAWATSRADEKSEDRDEVSSLAADSDDGDLQQVETAHSMQPLQSPAVERRPDLERHITTISTSSGEEFDSDELSDSDDEDDRRGRTGGQDQGYFLSTSNSEPAPVPAPAPASADEAAVSPLNEREDPAAREPAPQLENQRVPIPILTPAPKDRADDDEVSPTRQKIEPTPDPAAPTEKTEPAAQAPVVATGPRSSDTKAKEPEKPKEEKEKRGLRGLISRLKGGDKDSKSDGKLHKNRSSSEPQQPEKGFQGGAKFTSPQKKDETAAGSDMITPVTTTSAGKSAEGAGAIDPKDDKALPQHMGTDGPIGDQEGRVASTSNPAANEANAPASPTSASSFKRHDGAMHDPDDVSSSGAEEEDMERGRAGRSARKAEFPSSSATQGEAPTVTTTAPSTSRPAAASGERASEEQFEEARDHFDESLAPPAAFAGQPKSQSPVRETKFTERF